MLYPPSLLAEVSRSGQSTPNATAPIVTMSRQVNAMILS